MLVYVDCEFEKVQRCYGGPFVNGFYRTFSCTKDIVHVSVLCMWTMSVKCIEDLGAQGS